MYRALVPVLNLIAALTIGGVFQAGVSLNIQAPEVVVAGTEFEVKVNVQKGDLESFSRLQQSLPAGLKATSSYSSNADFTFEEKRVRFIWMRMPKQQDFSVVYKIKVDERLKGTFTIDGKFSYIDQNERKSIGIASGPIVISPSPDIDPSLIVDVEDFEDLVIPQITPTFAAPQMACIRQTPIPEPNGDSYIVNLLVNKESKQKFAKIEETIPEGFSAENIDPRESIFTFKGNTAKFLWMNLPSDQFFLVSYKLVPKNPNSKSPLLKGKFSYLEGEKTISLDIKQTSIDLASVDADQISNILASASDPLLAQTQTGSSPADMGSNSTQEIHDQNTSSQLAQSTSTVNTTRTTRDLKDNNAYMIEPENGIYYRVQLAAGHKSVNIPRYFKKFKLDKEVRKEMHEGWHKYSIGSFAVYREARDYRVHIWNTTPIDDAFVSAYNDGQRITVQEALMVGNQQWYE